MAFAGAAHAANPADFAVFDYLGGPGKPGLHGLLYVPADAKPGETFPLVIYFHGLGCQGDNKPALVNVAQVDQNIDNLLAAARHRRFIVYAPQASWSWKLGELDMAVCMLARTSEIYPVDTSRMYTIGWSLGGGVVWDINTMYPGVFAAAVPISSVVPKLADYPAALAPTPIWGVPCRRRRQQLHLRR